MNFTASLLTRSQQLCEAKVTECCIIWPTAVMKPPVTLLIMICLERSVIHIIHWIICYTTGIYFTNLWARAGYPFQLPEYTTLLHKKSFIVRVLYKHVILLATDLLLLCVIVISFYKVAFVCAFVTWIKDNLLTYLLTLGALCPLVCRWLIVRLGTYISSI